MCDVVTPYSTLVTINYLYHTIFEIRSFNKYSDDEFQTLFSTKINRTLRCLLFVNKFEIFLEVYLKWFKSIISLSL